MENLPNPLEILLRIEQRQINLEKKLVNIEQNLKAINKKLNLKSNLLENDFDIVSLKKAAKMLRCSIDTLKNAMKNNILKQNIDYRFNGKRTYIFSSSSLQKHKGNI